MKSKFTWILTLLLVLCVQIGFAQQKQISGSVQTEYGDPLEGAVVTLEGTNQGTATDENGNYTLMASQGDKIKVEIIGFVSKSLTVSASNILNFTLIEEGATEIDEIVITGYATQNKKESAVAQTTITNKTIEGRPNANIIQTLQGQVPGLNIMTGSGQPGSDDTSVVLRGLGSINGKTSPLYVIDGVPMSDERFRSINQNDIASVSVLKDAGATSIYGNRGANGVIVITTKRGGFEQDLTVKYTGLTGVAFNQEDNYNLFDGPGLMEFERYLYQKTNRAIGRNWRDNDIANARTTDWMDVFFSPAIQQNHTISFSAGSKNLASHTSVGYANYEGTLTGTNLQRFNFRNNFDGKNNSGRLTYGTNISLNYSKNRMLDATGTNNIYHNYFIGANRGLPYVHPEDYNWGATYDDVYNAYNELGAASTPIVLLDRRKNVAYRQNELKALVNGSINYKLNDNWTISNQSGIDLQTIQQPRWYTPTSFHEVVSKPVDQEYAGWYSETNTERFIFTSTSSLKYRKVLNDVHTISAAGYIEYIKAHYNASSFQKTGFDPIFWAPGAGTGWIADTSDNDFYAPTASKSKFNSGLFSYFAQASYDYDGRFGFDGTIRRDASFRFTKDNQWGTFWSVAGRWNISNEDWMMNSAFNDLKLRASYGTSGNQDILGTGWFGAANLFSTLYSSETGYKGESALTITQLPNTGLRWETTEQANIGVDFGVFNDRLRGSVDVYQKKTKDLFLSQRISAINGANSIPANFGDMKNEGVEVLLAGDVLRKQDARITLTLNGSYNKNTVLSIPEETGYYWNGSSLVGYREGSLVNEFYMYKYAGVDQQTGEALFYTQDGSTTTAPTDDDRHWLGKAAYPKFQGGFGIDAEYKGFFLTANFTYATDVYRYDNSYLWYTNPAFVGPFNMSADYYDFWTPDNRDAVFPSPTAANNSFLSDSDFYVRDASYVRLRFLSLGYNFKPKDLAFLKLSGLRVYAQAENLLTWTDWKGFDAESNRGVDLDQYPTSRSVSFGIEVQF